MPAKRSIEVRAAHAKDSEAIARLAGELGYPSTAAEVRERLDAILGNPEHATFVAISVERGAAKGMREAIVGWIQLSEARSLTTDPRAEIAGLVVDSVHRGGGVGRLLLERGEAWARERGMAVIGLHSNVVRERAHVFYERLGYKMTKSQKVYRKRLQPGGQ